MRTYDAIVVGAGYIGCSVAYYLSAAGISTALIDRGDVPGGASLANFGNIQVQDAELGRSLPMVTAGYRRLIGLENELGCSVGYQRVGGLLVIETEAHWRIMAERLPALHAAGIRAELVPAEHLVEIEPLLDKRRVMGACYYPDEGRVYPFWFLGAFLRRAREHGLTVEPHTEVTGLTTRGGRIEELITPGDRFSAGVVVLATGAWAPALGRLLGRRWAIPHVHGQAMITERSDARLRNHISSAAFFEEMHGEQGTAQPKAVLAMSQTHEGHFLLGEAGTVTDDLGSHATWEGQGAIAREVTRFFPALARLRVVRGWAAPVAFTADGLPFLGPVGGIDGLILATAFKSTVIVTPLVGEAIAQLICEGRTELDLSPFSPDREIGHDQTA